MLIYQISDIQGKNLDWSPLFIILCITHETFYMIVQTCHDIHALACLSAYKKFYVWFALILDVFLNALPMWLFGKLPYLMVRRPPNKYVHEFVR